ncbi:hypothetical protein [Pseudomonas citronellolis]|uniref:hypothetical protein n=1 Tax=Pseudomonas citronellolis TaxID=53408 RepID=UPI003C2E5272
MLKANPIALGAFFSIVAQGVFADQQLDIPIITELKYNKAREILIAHGWQPAITVNLNKKMLDPQAELFRKVGYVEINDCAGTGASPCVLYFKNATGAKLKVNTIGESNITGDDFPIVSNYEIVSEIPGQPEDNRTSAATAPQEQNNSSTYPVGTKYLAEVTCSFGQRKVNVISCFLNTDLKIHTATSAEIYKAYNLPAAGRFDGTTLIVPLQEHFELTAQNSHKTLVLGVTIRDLEGNVGYTDKVGQYEVIRVQN